MLILRLVRNKRLDDKRVQLALCCSDLNLTAHALVNPLLGTLEVHVDLHKAQFPASLDQLVWFRHQPLSRARHGNRYGWSASNSKCAGEGRDGSAKR